MRIRIRIPKSDIRAPLGYMHSSVTWSSCIDLVLSLPRGGFSICLALALPRQPSASLLPRFGPFCLGLGSASLFLPRPWLIFEIYSLVSTFAYCLSLVSGPDFSEFFACALLCLVCHLIHASSILASLWRQPALPRSRGLCLWSLSRRLGLSYRWLGLASALEIQNSVSASAS